MHVTSYLAPHLTQILSEAQRKCDSPAIRSPFNSPAILSPSNKLTS